MEREINDIIKLIDVTHSGWNRKVHELVHKGLVFQCEFVGQNNEPYEYKIIEVSASGKVKLVKISIFNVNVHFGITKRHTRIHFLKGLRAICSNSKYYSQQESEDSNSLNKKKRCSASVCFRPDPEKIKIIEDGMKGRGKIKYKIDPNTPDDYLFDPSNYTIYHKHKGKLASKSLKLSILVYQIR